MTARAHGLVIGKFYPPHAGHHLLVRAASSSCDRVTVVVMASDAETIPLDDRVGWMRQEHAADGNVVVTGIEDNVRIDYGDPAIWDQHVALMREALAAIDAPPVTAVFTSEGYGAELARRFGAVPVTVDVARTLAPVSGTQLRADPVAGWDFLAPPVRAGLALKVVCIGAESTGTTTVSLAILDRLRARGGAHGLTRWVGEYGREYSIRKYAEAIAEAQIAQAPIVPFAELRWESHEFLAIAREQQRRQDAEAALGGPVLICDTDAFATAVWHERYVGGIPADIEELAQSSKGDLYLVTHDEGVPFVQDGVRDGEAIRSWMTRRFIERLEQAGRRYVVLRGTPHERTSQALAEIDRQLRAHFTFGKPLR